MENQNPNSEFKNWYERVPGKFYTHPIPTNFSEIFGYCNFHALYKHVIDNVPTDSTVVEIGTLAGHSAAYMTKLIEISNKNINFYSIDPLPDLFGTESVDYYSQEFDVTMYELFLRNMKSLNAFEHLTHMRTTSEKASKLFDNESIDFIFIDGDHTTEGVMNDINCWLPKMKKNSIISGHDFDHETVRTGVLNIFGNAQIAILNTSWIVELGDPSFGIIDPVNKIQSSNLDIAGVV